MQYNEIHYTQHLIVVDTEMNNNIGKTINQQIISMFNLLFISTLDQYQTQQHNYG